MKYLIFVLLFLFSCSTPESKIEESFRSQRMHRQGSVDVQKVEIYDTIWQAEFSKNLEQLEIKLNEIYKKPTRLELFKDSIFRIEMSRHMKDSIMKSQYKRASSLEREIDRTFRKRGMYYSLYNPYQTDSINGFYARIITKTDTFSFVVHGKTYKIVCPVFMFE